MQSSPIQTSLSSAATHYHAGRIFEADAIYRQLITERADVPFITAVSMRMQHRWLQAIDAFNAIVSTAPTHIEALLELAAIHHSLGQFDRAMVLQKRAVAFKPDSATARNDLAMSLMNRDQFEQATDELQHAIKLNPAMPRFHGNLARLYGRQQHHQLADEAFHAAINTRPDCATSFHERGLLLLEIKAIDPAISDFLNAVQLLKHDARPHLALAKAHLAKSEFGAAQHVLESAIEIIPDCAELFLELATLMQSLGRFDQASALAARSLSIQSSGTAALMLTRVSSTAPGAYRELLTELTGDLNQTPRNKAAAGFALGDVLDKSGEFDDAFAAYDNANRLFKHHANLRGERFDPWILERNVSQAIQTYSPEYFRMRKEFGQTSDAPVFIVGMPRSGTSLVEQILASHSQVCGLGELPDIGWISARLSTMDRTDYPEQRHWHRHLARLHLAKLEAHAGGAARIVDKMPANLLHLGLIATLFPGARIILCRRDPIDTCLSCYFQLFENFNLMFSYSLHDCVTQSQQNDRLIDHWKAALPLQMLEVSYETLVNDPEPQSRRLIDFLGLEWESGCLDFYNASRPVFTRSAWQVRQKIYHKSLHRWKNYQAHLGPLNALAANPTG